MNSTITVIQVILALFAGAAGSVRLFTPYARFTRLPAQGWSVDFEPWKIKLIGILEVSAAIGIVASLFMQSLTMVTALAAAGVALVMAGAMATHFRREEYVNMVGNFVWLGLALFLAYSTLVGFTG